MRPLPGIDYYASEADMAEFYGTPEGWEALYDDYWKRKEAQEKAALEALSRPSEGDKS